MREKKPKGRISIGGFTLVELIVVIAILGILAGVAYPVYTGYIKRANDAKVLTSLSYILDAAQSSASAAGAKFQDLIIFVDGGRKGAINVWKADEAGTLDWFCYTIVGAEKKDEDAQDAYDYYVDSMKQLGNGKFDKKKVTGDKTGEVHYRVELNLDEFPELKPENLKNTSYWYAERTNYGKDPAKEESPTKSFIWYKDSQQWTTCDSP